MKSKFRVNFLSLSIILLIGLSPVSCGAKFATSVITPEENAKNAVAILNQKDAVLYKIANGVAIHDSLVVVPYHVIKNSKNAKTLLIGIPNYESPVEILDIDTLELEIVGFDEKSMSQIDGLVVLKVNHRFSSRAVMAKFEEIKFESGYYTVGFRFGPNPFFFWGGLSQISEKRLSFSILTQRGMSGSGIYNAQGHLVAITVEFIPNLNEPYGVLGSVGLRLEPLIEYLKNYKK